MMNYSSSRPYSKSSYEESEIEKYSRYVDHIYKCKNKIIYSGFHNSDYFKINTLNALFQI